MAEAAEIERDRCKHALALASAEGYLDRLENAIHLIGASLKETQGFRPLNHAGLLDAYCEGRARLACYLDVTHGSADRGCLLAFENPHFAVNERVTVGVAEGQAYRSHSLRRDQEPMFVDIAQLIECPKGFAQPALIGLHIIDDGILKRFGQEAEASFPAHLTGEALCIVGEWEAGIFTLARDGKNKCADDIVQCGTQVSDCVSNDRFGIAAEIVERLKIIAQSVPLLRLDGQSVVVCTEPAIDPGIKVRNVMACAV